jgi:pyrimidine-nucleoside phosphorylase
MFGQTPEVAPADRRLYALRDVTGTVESIPLIASSIMSKKLSEGLTGLVLDAKNGSGALMTDQEDALELARAMVELGVDRGCPTVALVTAMDRPLGIACGNALETREAVGALRGQGPADLMEVTYALGGEMLLLAGVERDRSAARRRLERVIATGDALRRFGEIISAQGGDAEVLTNDDLLPRSPLRETYAAPSSGVVGRVEPRVIGKAIVAMGGGRQRTDDRVDHGVGFEITAKPGDRVQAGQPLALIHAADEGTARIARAALDEAIRISPRARKPLPLISHRVGPGGVDIL